MLAHGPVIGKVSPTLTRRKRHDRSRSRAWFLQVHYLWETGDARTSFLKALAQTREHRMIAPSRLPYLLRLADAFSENVNRIEDAICAALDNWRLDRLSVMDRGILRLGAVEILLLDDLPGKVAILEAVRLAERYGGSDSPRFVNGVLDAVFRVAQNHRSPDR